GDYRPTESSSALVTPRPELGEGTGVRASGFQLEDLFQSKSLTNVLDTATTFSKRENENYVSRSGEVDDLE
ncbi:MAG: hypothetical protein NT023_00825, partial [Armatimonadetes bacterium]|nr:hypothetical protein [Armatimonadota bacterium]